MLKNRLFLVFLIFFFIASSACAQVLLDSEQLISQSVGKRFYEIAYELSKSEDIDKQDVEQGIVLLTAAMNLDPTANYVYPVLIELVGRDPSRDYSELVRDLLERYMVESTDLEPARKAVQYLLQQLDSREQREQLLEDLLSKLGGKNSSFDSELTTLLGLLVIEKADEEAAKSYFIKAFKNDGYNQLAFEKLMELAPEQIEPSVYFEHLRLALGKNPLDLEAALAFAQYAERMQLYQTAADTYEYCVKVFHYLYPLHQLPSSIYIPWMISNYNTRRNQHKCLQIASQLRQNGRFDLSAEAIAVKTAEKIGDEKEAMRILKTIGEKISSQASEPDSSQSEGISNLAVAWFYCFVSPDPNRALDWANKAYSVERDSTMASVVLAYSLVMNGQLEWAKPLIGSYKDNQIAGLTLAQIQLAEGQEYSAIETLKSAINKDPGSLEAEHAKEILALHGGEYSPPIDPNVILATLVGSFGRNLVPEFLTPDKIISAQLNIRGDEFSYGSDFGSTITITNNSAESLVVSDDGLFAGNIRIDANLTGDINKKLSNLVSMKIRPALPVKSGQSIFIPIDLFTGELRKTLLTYPQASVNIEFKLYLDPVADNQGGVTNRMWGLEPTRLTVKRPGIKLTGAYLQNRLASLSEGQQSQKIKTSQLFISLLMEQQAMAKHEQRYKFMYADWMQDTLRTALVQNLTDYDWVVKANTMADMTSLPLDYKLIRTLSENLDDDHWPVRLMALYLMAKNQGSNFAMVLDWTAKEDLNEYVRDMAVALGGVDSAKGAAPKPEDVLPERPPTISYSY